MAAAMLDLSDFPKSFDPLQLAAVPAGICHDRRQSWCLPVSRTV